MAKDLHDVGAGYILFMIGENSGFYVSPNAAYDKAVGRSPSWCSKRDLIKDLGTALKPYGIRLIVYLPSKGPGRDLPAMAKLGLGNSTSRVPGHQTA